jgi:succinate dehydrogenase/fumarate reductase flavoprotein subunit
MWDKVGPFRTGTALEEAHAAIGRLHDQLSDTSIAPGDTFNLDVQDWFELKAMLRTADAVVTSARNRAESRGAHQRLDIPHTLPAFERNQLLSSAGGVLSTRWRPVVHSGVRSA